MVYAKIKLKRTRYGAGLDDDNVLENAISWARGPKRPGRKPTCFVVDPDDPTEAVIVVNYDLLKSSKNIKIITELQAKIILHDYKKRAPKIVMPVIGET